MRKIDELLKKEMSRRQFLTVVGFGLLSLIGLPAFMGMLGHMQNNNKSGIGYGNGPYGR